MKRGEARGAGFRHSRALGQNFLTDEALLAALAERSLAGPLDTVLEIGPGEGSLTRALALRAGRVVPVELDERLRVPLLLLAEEKKNVVPVFGDCLSMDLASLAGEIAPGGHLRFAANLPYYITSDILKKVLSELPRAESIAVMVQKEVGEKLLAGPGEAGYGPLGIRLLRAYRPLGALDVPAECFTPPPKVDSCFLTLVRRAAPEPPVRDEAFFLRLLEIAFRMRRKTLANNLMAGCSLGRAAAAALLELAGIGEKARAEEVSPEAFCRLSDAMTEA